MCEENIFIIIVAIEVLDGMRYCLVDDGNEELPNRAARTARYWVPEVRP